MACCNMILRWSLHYDDMGRDDNLIINFIELEDRHTPLWTIEMFYLLKGYDLVELAMHTVYLGVNPSHATIDWYTTSKTGMNGCNFELINDMFTRAIHQYGWNIHEVRQDCSHGVLMHIFIMLFPIIIHIIIEGHVNEGVTAVGIRS